MTELITRQDLKTAIEKGDVTVVDALGGMYYEKQHLPGAVPLVAEEVSERAPDLLPDKAAPVVTYCSNEACPNSGNVASMLTQAGYTNVRKYKEGIEDWVQAGLPTESGSPTS